LLCLLGAVAAFFWIVPRLLVPVASAPQSPRGRGCRERAGPPGAAARVRWARSVEAGDRARVRGPRGEGREQRVRGRTDEALAEGEAEGVGRRGGPLAASAV